MDDFLGKLLGQAQDKSEQDDTKDYLFGNYTIPYEDPTSYMGQDTVDNPMLQFGKEALFNHKEEETVPVEDPRIADLQAKLQLLQKSSGKLYKAKDEPDVDLKKYLADNKDVMQRALESQNKQQFINNLAKAGSMIGSSIAGGKPQDTSLIDSLNKQSGEVVGQAENEQKQNMNIVRLLQDQKMQREAREARKEAASLAAQIRQDSKNLQIGEKQDQFNQKRLDTLNTKLSAEMATGKSAFGQAARNLASAQAIEVMIAGRDLNDLNGSEIYELARSLDRLISQGSVAIRGTEHLIPKTAHGDVNQIAQYILNKRRGASAGDFAKQMVKTALREKDFNSAVVRDTQGKFLGGYKDLQNHPSMTNILESHGLPVDVFDYKKDEKSKVDQQLESLSKGKSLTTTKGKIKVSNGSETLEIDPEDLKHALADGYKQI